MFGFLTEIMNAIAQFFTKLTSRDATIPPSIKKEVIDIKPVIPVSSVVDYPVVEIPKKTIYPEEPLYKVSTELPDKYFKHILNSEGGYSNHPADTGGETNRGITSGTLIKAKARGIAPVTVTIRDLTDRLDVVYDIYNRMYYRDSYANKMQHPLSFAYFDACVNHGLGGRTTKGTAVGAGMLLQSMLRESYGANITLDGRVGMDTLNAIITIRKDVSPYILAEKFNDRREVYYRRIVSNNPSKHVFLKGWMNRLDKVRKFCQEAL